MGPGHLQTTTHSAWEKSERLHFLTKQCTPCTSLPSTTDNLFLATCCKAVSAQRLFVTTLRPEPRQTNILTLAGWASGRRQQRGDLGASHLHRHPTSCLHHHNYDGERHVPAAPEQPQLTPTTPCEPVKGARERARISSSPSPSSDNSSHDDRARWHSKLAVGKSEEMMAELLRWADKKEVAERSGDRQAVGPSG